MKEIPLICFIILITHVLQGVWTCISEIITDNAILKSLWKHKYYGVIDDRFVNMSDKDWFV